MFNLSNLKIPFTIMNSEIQMNSSSIQSLLIILVIICAISYAYLEFRKINSRLEIIEKRESRTQQMFLELKESLNKDQFTSAIKGDDDLEKGDINEGVPGTYDEEIQESNEEPNVETTEEQIDVQMDSISQCDENQEIQEIQEIQEQQPNQEEVYEQPTVMSFSFLSTMNHVETPMDNDNDNNGNDIEDITEETEEVINDLVADDLVSDDSETKIIKTDKYDHCTVKELKDILTEKNLPTSGNKTKLIQRIVENSE